MFTIPLISAIADAGAVIIDKIVLGRRRMEVRVFIPTLFIFLFVITVLLFPLLGWVDTQMIRQSNYLFLFILMIVLAITWNIFYYQSIQKEKLYEHELIIMLAPAMTILLASVFFPEEYQWKMSLAAFIAAVALFISRLERDHFTFDKYSLNLMVAVLLMSLEIIVIRELLYVFSPVALYALRTGFVALFFLVYYRPRLSAVCTKNAGLVLASAILGVIYMVLRFYGYKQLGVVHTTLILILAPLLVYLSSALFLNEKIKLKTIISAVIILGCIIYVTFLDFLK